MGLRGSNFYILPGVWVPNQPGLSVAVALPQSSATAEPWMEDSILGGFRA